MPLTRRAFVATAGGIVASFGLARPPALSAAESIATALQKLEGEACARLGVYAVDSGTGEEVRHRADERFPLCSTFKVILAAAILQRSAAEAGLLTRRLRYSKEDLVTYSPVSERHVETGMTVGELCAAALQYSDNSAANLLMKLLGGPSAVTEFARTIGNHEFRLDRWETALNTALPGDLRDTATPASMGRSLQHLVLGEALPLREREQLAAWMLDNTTGAKRIRAGTPPGWRVGDKTGSGDYGTANDIAVLWPPGRKPIVLAVYLTQKSKDAPWDDATIAASARLVVEALSGKAVSHKR